MTTARRMWSLFEPYHGITYFAPESRAAVDELGCRGFWMGYFGMRSAPLGAASPELVTATFYNFHPARVGRAVPDTWVAASPGQYLLARLAGVDAALRRMLGDEVISGDEMAEAAELGRRAARYAPIAGRPLAAANAALAWPEPPHLALWHATTVLRESRGDGHIAALVAAGLDPVETLVTFAADQKVADRAQWQTWRGWVEQEWTAAGARLIARGLLGDDGELTAEGTELRRWVEERTDSAAQSPWDALGQQDTARFAELLTSFLRLLVAAGDGVVQPHPMGLDPVRTLEG